MIINKNMFNPKVSIIIPVYNGSNYLEEAIISALEQTYKNIEIIVVNDGSNDNGATEKIALSFGDKINYYYKKNGGVSTALNLALKKMTGEYFSWLSHDDLYYPNKITIQVQFLSHLNNKKVILTSNVEIIDKKSKHIKFINLNYNTSSFLYDFLTKKNLNGITLLIPKECFIKVGNFEEGLESSQDFKLWFKFLKKYNFIHIDKYLAKYRNHNMQDSKTKKMKGIIETYKLEKFVLNYFNIMEIYKSSGATLPVNLFKYKLYYILIKPKIPLLLIEFCKNIKIYEIIQPIWIKYFLKNKNK